MDLDEAIMQRRSVRAFTEKDVPKDVVEKIVELASWAPSAGNLQSRDFIIVRERKMRNALAVAALGQDFVAEAPVVIAVVANMKRVAPYGSRGRELYAIQDSAASIQNILLAAHAKGLASVWVGAFNEKEASRILGLPPHARPVALIPIGYPAEHPSPPRHLKKEEYVHYEKW